MANLEKIALTIVQETAYTWLFVTKTRERVKAAAADMKVRSVTQVSTLVHYRTSTYIAQNIFYIYIFFQPNP